MCRYIIFWLCLAILLIVNSVYCVLYIHGVGLLASKGWLEVRQPSSQGKQEPLVVKTRLRDARWASGDQVHGMLHFSLQCFHNVGRASSLQLESGMLVMTNGLEICMSYSSSCHHHLHHHQLQYNTEWRHSGASLLRLSWKMAIKWVSCTLYIHIILAWFCISLYFCI